VAAESDRLRLDLAAPPGAAALLRYLPVGTLEQLRRQPGTALRPAAERFQGAVLLTDLAGFSRLTGRFSAQGPEGVERLSSVLDSYFSCVTEIVLDHGGDVADFVGDAVVAVWPQHGPPAECVALATACGLALQQALQTVIHSTGLELRQRVSIAAGELTRFVVGGGAGRWYSLVAGAPLRQAGACNHLAQPGEVVVCDSAWARLDGRGHGRPLPDGHTVALGLAPQRAQRCQPPPGLTPDRRIEQFLPRPLLERARNGPAAWAGEFRDVCAVFVGFADAAADTLQPLQRVVEALQAEFGGCGGSLEKLWIDSQGPVALAAFGLPGQTHEDDAARAVRAAGLLSARLGAAGIRCSIGIAAGRAFHGDSGGPGRRHMTLVGEVMNRAARLSQAADDILCDEAIARAAAHRFAFATRPPLRLKDGDPPIAALVPGDARDARPPPRGGTLTGRDSELRQLAGQLDLLPLGRGGLLVLQGEAGIGKSRLLDEAAVLAQRRSIRVLRSHGAAVEAGTALFPWRRLLLQLLCAGEFDPAAARDELQRRLGGEPQLRAWLPLLNDLLPLQYPHNDVTGHMDPAARASAIRALLLRLLEPPAGEPPLMLMVDDLHWFDEASLGILAAALAALPGLLMLGGTRPPEPATAAGLAKLLQQPGAVKLQLEQLAPPAVEQLACGLLGVGGLPPPLAEFLNHRCGGNPFYAEELLLGLRSAGLIEVRQQACRLHADFGGFGATAVPGTLQGVIISRVDRLPRPAQHLLQLVSVIGREFPTAMLRDLLPGLDEESIRHSLQALQQADLLRPAGAAGEYRLKHAILCEAVYELLPYAQRRQFHRDVALWIEQHQAADLRPYYAELALHWERTGDIPRALGFLEKAGALAFERFANREAIAHIRRAYRLAQTHALPLDGRQIENCEAILGDAHQELFEYHTAALHFRRCLAQLGLPVPATRGGLVLALFKELLLQLWLRLGRSGAAAPGQRQAARRAAHIYQRLAESSFFDNRATELLHQILCSVNLGERSGATREVVDGFGAMAVVAAMARLQDASRFYNRRSMEVAQGAENPFDAAYGYLVDMVYWATAGNWVRQERSTAPAESIYRQLGCTVRWQQSQSLTYTPLIAQGRFAEARPVLRRAQAAMAPDTPSQILSFYGCSMLGVALATGDELEPLVNALQAAQGPDLHRSDRLRSLGLVAKARQRLGQHSQALAAADAALDIVRQSPPAPWHIADGMAAAAEVYLDAWEASGDDTTRRKAAEVCRALRGYARRVPVAGPAAARQYARLLFLDGRRRRARRWWQQALTAAQQLGMAYEEATALLEMGGRLTAAEGGGQACLMRAERAFAAMGAGYDHARARRLCGAAAADGLAAAP
jgi:class 3 adenylate cyclase/tetratricopeptide (TPR) repeat protein